MVQGVGNIPKSKTKCLYLCGKTGKVDYPAKLYLNNRKLPFVEEALHLGHHLHQSCNFDYDVQVKKAQFINTSVEIRDTFSFAEPSQVLAAVRVYAGHYYGSMLWQLDSDMVGQFCRTWSTCVKLTYDCPRYTKTWLVENLLAKEFLPVKTELMARYITFYHSLLTSASDEVCFLVKTVTEDVRSTPSRNLNLIRQETDLDPLIASAMQVKLQTKKLEIPANDSWRLETLEFLLKERREREASLQDVSKISAIINALCA